LFISAERFPDETLHEPIFYIHRTLPEKEYELASQVVSISLQKGASSDVSRLNGLLIEVRFPLKGNNSFVHWINSALWIMTGRWSFFSFSDPLIRNAHFEPRITCQLCSSRFGGVESMQMASCKVCKPSVVWNWHVE
jgi:hypothetical protein